MPATASRAQIAKLIRATGTLVTVAAAAKALSLDAQAASKVLARWTAQGKLRRLRRGLYAVVPLAANPEDGVVEDAWQLVPRLFSPGYVGGATAAHHWDLTEQLFRTTFVFTARRFRQRELTVQGAEFALRYRASERLFGTRAVWRGATRVELSDLHRTIVDMLDDPSTGGGIRHVADCLRAYVRRREASPETLLDYAARVGNGAIFKRLGFLLEGNEKAAALVAACRERLTAGVVKLDPAIGSKRLVTRWRLWVPADWPVADGRRTGRRGDRVGPRGNLVEAALHGPRTSASMRPSEALQKHRGEVRALVGRFPTVNPRVFGLVLHGTDTEESDVDFLVDALPGASLLDLGGLQVELEELLGVRVDVLTPQELSAKFRQAVLAEAMPL